MPTLKARIGGTWVDVGGSGGGASEVEVGPNDPIGTNSSAELWYDTDASAPLIDDLRWFTAWGVVATGTFAFTDGTALAVNANLTNPITYTTLAGRRYKFRVHLRAVSIVTTAGVSIGLKFDGTVQGNDTWTQIISSTGYTSPWGEWIVVGDGGSHTFVATWLTAAASAGFAGVVYLEDMGPVTGAAIIPQVAVTPWTAFPFAAGWGNFGGGYQSCQYRKCGDMVQLRGLATTTTTTATTTIGTLPGGFCPLVVVLTIAKSVWNTSGGQRMDIFANGIVSAEATPAATGNWCSLEGIQFSVST